MDADQLADAGLLEGITDGTARAQRIDLLQQLLVEGFSLEDLRHATRSDRRALLPVERVLHHEDVRYTRTDIAELSGASARVPESARRALGLADPGDEQIVFGEADLEAAKLVARYRAAGLDEDTLCQINRVLGHGIARLSETILQLVGDALMQAGDNEQTLGLRYAQAAEHLIPPLTPLLGYVLAVQFKDQIKNAIITQAELSTGRAENAREVTVCFADLVDFTRLGERVPPAELSNAGQRLTEIAIEAARPPVRLVKMIGDAAMFVSPDPEPLVQTALALVATAEAHSQAISPLRVGLANGQAICESGEWFGMPVNLASRVTNAARPATVLATKSVRSSVEPSFAWSFAGKRRFK